MNPYNRKRPHERPICETPLADWLRETGTTRYELARRIGCDPKVVGLWATGQTEIGLIYAFMVERATHGQVLVASWLGTDLFKTRMRDLGCDWDNWRAQKAAGNRERRAQQKKAG